MSRAAHSGAGVGKTSLVVRYAKGTFTQNVTSTIGAAFFTHKLCGGALRGGHVTRAQVGGQRAGQSADMGHSRTGAVRIGPCARAMTRRRFRSMAPMYYRGASAAILVYDVTNADSFDAMPGWIKGALCTRATTVHSRQSSKG